MAKVKLNFDRLSVPEKIIKARQIVTALTGNADFTNPVPPLTAITAAVNNLNTAYTTAQANRQAWRTAVTDQSMKEDVLGQLLSQCASYVESVAGPNEVLINSAGMSAKAIGSASAVPAVPTALDVTIGDHEGDLDLSWDPVSNAKSYLIQRSVDPNNTASWTHAGTSTKSSATIDGLTSGTRYWLRVCAVGAVGQSGWSDPATKIAP